MATPTITECLKYANLQMAAEAFIRNESTGILAVAPEDIRRALVRGNNRTLRFTEKLKGPGSN